MHKRQWHVNIILVWKCDIFLHTSSQEGNVSILPICMVQFLMLLLYAGTWSEPYVKFVLKYNHICFTLSYSNTENYVLYKSVVIVKYWNRQTVSRHRITHYQTNNIKQKDGYKIGEKVCNKNSFIIGNDIKGNISLIGSWWIVT